MAITEAPIVARPPLNKLQALAITQRLRAAEHAEIRCVISQ